jgi:hypothetical protein
MPGRCGRSAVTSAVARWRGSVRSSTSLPVVTAWRATWLQDVLTRIRSAQASKDSNPRSDRRPRPRPSYGLIGRVHRLAGGSPGCSRVCMAAQGGSVALWHDLRNLRDERVLPWRHQMDSSCG